MSQRQGILSESPIEWLLEKDVLAKFEKEERT